MLARVAIVTGANRGLGLALAESLAESGTHVVLAARDEQLCSAAATALATAKGYRVSVEAVQLDVRCARSIEAFGAYCEQTFGGVDLLVNNAAVCEAGWSEAIVGRALRTNVLGPCTLTRRLLPALRERPHAQVLHISSGDGELLYLSPELQRQMAAVDSERALFRLLAAARPPPVPGLSPMFPGYHPMFPGYPPCYGCSRRHAHRATSTLTLTLTLTQNLTLTLTLTLPRRAHRATPSARHPRTAPLLVRV